MSAYKSIYPWKCISALLFFYFILSSCTDTTPVKIGYVAGLTGRHSELGIGVRNGVMLAVETLNMAGGVNGRQIEVVIRDDKSDPVHGKKVISELINMELPVIIGPLLSKMAQTTITTIAGKNVLVISPTISTDAVIDKDDNFIRVIPESSFQAETIATAVTKTKHRKIAVVYDGSNSPYTKPIYTLFKKRIQDAGNTITYVNDLMHGQEKNFSKVAADVVASDSDALFIVTSGIDAGELCQQVRKRDQDIQFYGSAWVKAGKIIEIGGRSVEGMMLATIFERTEKSVAYKDFRSRFLEKYKSEPNFTSVYAYEAVMVMSAGMKRSKSFEPEKIKAAILEQGEFQGLEETFRINRFGDVERSKSLVQIQGGHFMRLDH